MEQDQGFPAAKLFVVDIYAVGFYEFSLGSCGIFMYQRHCHLFLFHVHLTKGGLTARVTGGWREAGSETETSDSSEKAYETRCIPAVRVHALLGHLRHLR